MFHKTEIENLLNKIQTDKNVSNIDKDLFREIKNDWTQSINQINNILSKLITKLKGENQTAQLVYMPFMKINDKFKEACSAAYENNIESDVKHRMTQLGIHREDMKMILKCKVLY